jgi:mRNA interferase MazF
MSSAQGYEFGHVVLVPFPFTGQTASKKRPVVVVSNAAHNRSRPDVVLMAVTSQIGPTLAFGEVWVVQWQAAVLLRASAIKPVFATLEQALVIRPLGSLAASDTTALRAAIVQVFQ